MSASVVLAAIALALLAPVSGGASLGAYPQVGNGPGHLGVASGGGPTQLSSSRLTVTGQSWVAQAGVVVGAGKVIGLATGLDTQGQRCTVVVAVNELNGQVVWTASVPPPYVSSWSSASMDLQNGLVLVASGSQVNALNINTGSRAWYLQADTGKNFVNASPAVASGAVYIVDYVNQTDMSNTSTLYAVNVVTGQLLWHASIGRTSGANTVAVSGGKAMVATQAGKFLTFDAATGVAYPELVLDTNGFFCGVTADGNSAYVVTYAFGTKNGPTKLYKVDTSMTTPTKVWEAVAPRTDVMPVVVGNMVLVSGGDGYPIFRFTQWDIDWPSLWAFDKATGQFLWKTETAGGWQAQPVCANNIVYVPTQVGPYTGSTSVLYAFDITKTPNDASFVVASTGYIGNNVAVANGNVYGTSPAQLAAFGPTVVAPITGDINGDGYVNVGDLQLLVAAWGSHATDKPTVGTPASSNWNPDADLNGDGYTNIGDLQVLVANWGAAG